MKLTVSTTGRRFVVELPEEACGEAFRDLVVQLLLKCRKPAEASACSPEIEPEAESQGTLHTEEKLLPASDKQKKAPGTYSYHGFLYIKCPECGSVRGFNARSAISRYRCKECGAESDLPDNLVYVDMKCECGSTFWYLTNMTDLMFDIPCLNCKTPVTVEYNKKDNAYETVRQERRKK
jgi:ribosomal protein S27E